MLSYRTVLRSALAGVIVAAAVACGTKDAPDPLQPGPQGRVRFVNLITDPARNPVNVLLESLPFGVNLTYTQSTPATLPAPAAALYSPVLEGNRTLVVQRTANTSQTLATIPIVITAGQDRTVYAIGGTSGGTVSAFSTTDDNTTAITAGQIRLRFVNLSPTAGAVDVFVTTSGADLSTVTPTVANLANGGASAYVSQASGTYQIRFVPAGTAPANRSANVLVDIAAQAFASGAARTVVLAENAASGSPLRGVVLTDR